MSEIDGLPEPIGHRDERDWYVAAR
jgi:hypothetical protein